jgi:GGDEF domain-containing protein
VASTEEATTPLPVQQPVEAPKTASIGMTFSSAGPTSTKRKLQQEAEEAKKKAKKDEARSSKPKAKKRKGPLSFRDE